MNVDMKILEALTIEREIPLERLITAIEIAVKTAYNELPEAKPFAHARLDRLTGEIKIVVPVFGPERELMS
jgi:N utilization substance protein A